MVNRYSLRFDAGERQGESVPIPPSGLTIGRRPDQTLQILDSSVSGRHAEIRIDAAGVLLRDVGSTNGTRVQNERVIEAHLAHGDRVVFGNVSLTFVDASVADRPAQPAQASVSAGGAEVERVSQKALARSNKRPKAAMFALIALAFVGAGAFWYLRRSGPVAARAVKPVAAPAGNLLDDYSFESESDVWGAVGNSPAAFQKASEARASGAAGISCDLEADTSAASRSNEIRGEPRSEYRAEGLVRCTGGARGAIGLEFSQAGDASQSHAAPLLLWSKPVEATPTFAHAEVIGTMPPGYTSVRVVVRGASRGAAGRVDVDDVALFAQPGAELPAVAFGERRLVSSGSPCVAATLLDGERIQLAAIQFRAVDSAFAGEPSPFFVREDPPAGGRIVLSVLDAPEGGDASSVALHLSCEATLRAGGSGAGTLAGRIATVGEDGYRTHGLEFERKRATDLLLGSGRDLVRLTSATPATFRGRAEEGASRITVEFEGAKPEVVMQLDFQRERVEAGNAAHAARGAEKRNELGESLRQWTLLLNAYPYEEALVREAEAARARLTEKGFEELRAVRADVDDARFFRLVALFRQARDKAQRIAGLYAPSEVEAEARVLLAEIETELVALEAGDKAAERARLVSIARALEASRAQELARAVQDYVRTRIPDDR